MGDVAALHALELQEEWGIELGWRRLGGKYDSELFTRREKMMDHGMLIENFRGMRRV